MPITAERFARNLFDKFVRQKDKRDGRVKTPAAFIEMLQLFADVCATTQPPAEYAKSTFNELKRFAPIGFNADAIQFSVGHALSDGSVEGLHSIKTVEQLDQVYATQAAKREDGVQ